MVYRERDTWRVARDWRGEPVIVDAQGRAPLRSRDRGARWDSAYLAAAAPALYNTLAQMTQRLEYLQLQEPRPYRRDVALVQAGHATLSLAATAFYTEVPQQSELTHKRRWRWRR